MQLEGLRIIVTGGAAGMGAHFAGRLAEAGARVAIGDVDEAGLAAVVARHAGATGSIIARRLDVSDPADCEAFVAWAAGEYGGIEALVNNAGIIRDGLLVKQARDTGEITTLGEAAVRAVHAVNLEGPVWMTRAVVAQMARDGLRPGVVVNMSSVARHGNRGQTSYVSSKAAVAANAVTWAREFAAFGVRCVAIAPGMVETPMTQGMNQRARDALVARIPVGRIGVPEDLWQALRFCIECDYFNGRCLDVDGGLVM
ncbi:MAG: hypothetical protein RIT45_1203 [Pseudomonadota bacterium]|jgi:3-oxoacyl-[acyl-carrier protein] reductase